MSTVPAEVANLTTAVDGLTTEVTADRAERAAHVADAQGARDTAQGHRTAAETARDQALTHAGTAATEAGNAAAAVSYQAMGAVQAAYSCLASTVKGALLDGAWNDTDPSWIDRCAHTSWENESLSGSWLGQQADEAAARAHDDAATGAYFLRASDRKFYRLNETSGITETFRGKRRKFPTLRMVTREDNRIIIWDASDPTLPMWAAYNAVNAPNTAFGFWRVNQPTKFVGAGQGRILFGIHNDTSNVSAGLLFIDFPSDIVGRYGDAATSRGGFGLTAKSGSKADDLPHRFSVALVNARVNAVAITVLPDAPTDPATGLPVPLIPTGTAGGVSAILENGTVADSLSTVAVVDLITTDHGVWWSTADSVFFATWADIRAGDGFGDEVSDRTLGSEEFDLLAIGDHLAEGPDGMIVVGGDNALGTAVPGLMYIRPNYADLSKSLVALQTSTYLTGLMLDPKGCWLADTDDTDLVEGVNLVTNGDDFIGATGTTPPNGASNVGWFDDSDGTYSVLDGVLTITNGTSGRTGFYWPISVVQGAVYEAEWVAQTGNVQVRITDTINPNSTFPLWILGLGSTGKKYFVAPSSTLYVSVTNYSTTSGSEGTLDKISLRRVDPDRSVNANPLTVHGTVTRTALDSGIVAYSGWSADNYLEQDYNADLDFGTGDFCMMGWVKTTASNDHILERGASGVDDSDGSFDLDFQSDGNLRLTVRDNAGASSLNAGKVNTGEWTFFVTMVSNSGTLISNFVNGYLAGTNTVTARSIGGSGHTLIVGAQQSLGRALNGSLALLRIGATAPTPEQIRHIYESERHLFTGDLPCVIGGTSDAVRAQTLDPVTGLLHALTPDGHSQFNPKTFQRTAYESGDWDWIAANRGLIVKG